MAKYSKAAEKKVAETMHEMHEGKLKSGGSGKKVTNPRQAIAIGLSEAREEGDKVPPKSGSKSSEKAAPKKEAPKKSDSKNADSKKADSKKAASKKSSPEKEASKKSDSKKSAPKKSSKSGSKQGSKEK